MNGAHALFASGIIALVASFSMEDRRIETGERVVGQLSSSDPMLAGHGPAKRFDFLPGATDRFTVSLDSVEFNGFLRVEGESGEAIVESDDGGIWWNARLVFGATQGVHYRIIAAATGTPAQVGEFVLSIERGEVPRLAGVPRSDATIAFHAAAAARALAQGRKKDAITFLYNEGGARMSRSQIEPARAAYEAMRALAKEIAEPVWEANALNGLGALQRAQGDFKSAMKFHDDALAIARGTGDLGVVARTLGELATDNARLENFTSARDLANEALALKRKLGDKVEIAKTALNLGNIQTNLGDYAAARKNLEESLNLSREVGEERYQAMALGSLGVIDSRTADHHRAEEHFRGQLELAVRIGQPSIEMAALANLAHTHLELGSYPTAREEFTRVVELARKIGDPSAEAAGSIGLGSVCRVLGELPAARSRLKAAADFAHERGFVGSEARARVNLAYVHDDLGETASALAEAEAALDLFARAGIEDDSLHALTIAAKAAVELRDAKRAATCLAKAREILDRPTLRGSQQAAATRLRSRFDDLGKARLDLVALGLEQAGSDAVARSRVLDEGFRDAGFWKGRALLEGIAEHRSGGRTAEATRLRRERDETLNRRGAVLVRLSNAIQAADTATTESLRKEVSDLLDRANDLASRLAAVSPRDAMLDVPAGADADAVRRAAIDAKTALIDFAPGRRLLYAFVLGAGNRLSFVTLGARGEVDAAVSAFLANVSDPNRLGSAEEVASTGRALFDRVLAPAVREIPATVERLVVVPDASLASVPFEALVTAPPRAEGAIGFQDLPFVLDRFEISYAPSSPVLTEPSLAVRHPERTKALVLADPEYAAGGPARLERTRGEALAVAQRILGSSEHPAVGALDRLRSERSASVHADRVDVCFGAEASKKRFEGDLKAYTIVHVAAHGIVDRESPERSGIALTGTGESGGFLTIADVLDLDLDADLVVLSACETAVGKNVAGEGVQSLAHAFLYAGARSVVASEWPVADWAAAESMRSFYEGVVGRGIPGSRALREAKLLVRRSASRRGIDSLLSIDATKGVKAPTESFESGHPFFWAPFIYIGVPR